VSSFPLGIIPFACPAKLSYHLGMLWLRKIIFYIFCLIYLVLTPLIIARMLGFITNPQTHRFVKTGLVYVATNPEDACVFIDGRMAHGTTPTVIRDLAPGKHFIRLQLDGYKDWEKIIPIVGKKATVLDNTLLIPEQWPIKKISQKPYQNLIPAGQGVLVASNPVLKNIDIFHTADQNNGSSISLFSKNSIYASGQLVRLFNADKSPYILLEALINDKHKFLWCDLKEKQPLIEDITDLLAQPPENIAWNSLDNKDIFAYYPHAIYRISIKTKTIEALNPAALPADMPINTFAVKCQQSFLINDKSTLLERKGRWIRIYPKSDFGVPESYDIAKSRPSTNMYFEEKNGELFYLDDDTLFLYAVKILYSRIESARHPALHISVTERLTVNTP
jgi:hypothetical protein